MTLLEAALACIRRGWSVCPCDGKITMYEGGYKNATTDEAQVRAWWTKTPNANPGIAPGKSGTTALDIDTGLADEESLRAFMRERNIPMTFAVRTGKRPQYRVQLHFQGCGGESFNGWTDGDFGGDLRATWGHVMAPGSIHPESGEPYAVLWDVPLAPVPAWVRGLKAHRKERVLDPAAPITEWRNDAMIRILGKMRADGADDEMIRSFAIRTNETRVQPPLDEDELERIISNACNYAPGAPDPVPVLSVKKETPEPKDWRELFHTKDEVLNCPPPTFLIEQFLQRQAICAIAAPVGQRKSIIALNVARSLVTKEPLFGVLPVLNQPSRVLYLCPEMGLVSLSERVRKIGIGDRLGDTLFVRSMNLGGLDLTRIPDAALDGSVLIIDTAIRFMSGDENSAKDTKDFSDILFNLQRRQGQHGAIVVLYHSPKAAKDVSELTLENCMRGSGELGAAITDAHGTRLQDTSDGWNSESFIRHIKVRDYPGLDDFNVACDRATGVLTKTGDAGVKAVLNVRAGGNKANRDGMDEAARAIVKANAALTVRALIAKLQDAGIDRKKTWVTMARMEAAGTTGGVRLTSD